MFRTLLNLLIPLGFLALAITLLIYLWPLFLAGAVLSVLGLTYVGWKKRAPEREAQREAKERARPGAKERQEKEWAEELVQQERDAARVIRQAKLMEMNKAAGLIVDPTSKTEARNTPDPRPSDQT